MSYIDLIQKEITTDTNGIGYSGFFPAGGPFSDDEIHKDPFQQAANVAIANLLNIQQISKPVTSIDPKLILRSISVARINKLSDIEIQKLNLILENINLDPNDPGLESLFKTLFGDASAEVTDLIGKRTKLISPAENIGIKGNVSPGWVAMARVK